MPQQKLPIKPNLRPTRTRQWKNSIHLKTAPYPFLHWLVGLGSSIAALAFERQSKEKALQGWGRMKIKSVLHHNHPKITSTTPTPALLPITCHHITKTQTLKTLNHNHKASQRLRICTNPTTTRKRFSTISAATLQPSQPLDLTEDNIRQVLADARIEFGQLFDTSVGMTGAKF